MSDSLRVWTSGACIADLRAYVLSRGLEDRENPEWFDRLTFLAGALALYDRYAFHGWTPITDPGRAVVGIQGVLF